MKKVQLLFLGLVVLLAFGCGKDDDKKVTPSPAPDPDVPAVPKCQLLKTKQVYSGGDSIMEDYIYNSVGQLTKIAGRSNTWRHGNSSYMRVPEYNNNGKISKLSDYINNVLEQYYTYEYNQQGQLIKYNRFLDYDRTGSDTIRLSTFFTLKYNTDNKLAEWNYFDALPTRHISMSVITYPTALTAVKEGYNVSLTGSPVHFSTTNYTFDDNKAPHLLLPAYFSPDGPEILSEHNPLSIIRTGHSAESFSYTYQYNAEGYPVQESLFNGMVLKTFVYNCQ